MGKGYNNFMSKKAFHPGSYANQKRIHEAEAKAEAKRKHDEETLAQYQKEQELFHQKSLVSKQSKEKLSLNFMYEAPPGLKKTDDKQADKVEWTETIRQGTSKEKRAGPIPDIDPTKKLDINKTTSSSSNVSLEWKREKPVNRNRAKTEVKQEIKKEEEIKRESQSPIIKKESQIDLQWSRKMSSNDSSRRIKQEHSDNSKHDSKRFKKEP